MKRLKLLLTALMLVAIASLYVSCPYDVDVGKRGPAGGLIFFDGYDGVEYECSDVLGKTTWEDAMDLASNYRGGGYNDWYLPGTSELRDIEEYLYDRNYISDTEMLWSTGDEYSNYGYGYARAYRFGNSGGVYPKPFTFNVRAVRRL